MVCDSDAITSAGRVRNPMGAAKVAPNHLNWIIRPLRPFVKGFIPQGRQRLPLQKSTTQMVYT